MNTGERELNREKQPDVLQITRVRYSSCYLLDKLCRNVSQRVDMYMKSRTEDAINSFNDIKLISSNDGIKMFQKNRPRCLSCRIGGDIDWSVLALRNLYRKDVQLGAQQGSFKGVEVIANQYLTKIINYQILWHSRHTNLTKLCSEEFGYFCHTYKIPENQLNSTSPVDLLVCVMDIFHWTFANHDRFPGSFDGGYW